MKKWIKRLTLFGLLGLLTVLLMNFRVQQKTKGKTFDTVEEVPVKKVGLLLGTGKHLGSGYVNLFYKYRIDAAIKLYKAGKVKYILISGDNSRQNYDEPTLMKEDLMAAGIPESAIYLDFAGFRTLDSIIRCMKVFNENDILIISQKFHNERAIFLAESNNMKAVGYNAQDAKGKYGLKTHLREYLARVKMYLDIWVGKEPKFLGEEIKIG
ncbi:MAG: protein SanA [Bacteroidetes bacterium]|nr:MAG: protein SanA [Bacteroidota bacterium]